MPRLAPQMNGTPCVIEHRVTLGSYERKQLAETVDAYRRDKILENIPNIMLGVAGIGLAVTGLFVVPVVGYNIGLALANAVPFDGEAAAETYEHMVANNVIRPLKGLQPQSSLYAGGELAVASYSVSASGVTTHSVPKWAQIVGVGWVAAQYYKNKGIYRTHGTARLNWLKIYPEEYAEVMAAEREKPPGTYVAPMGPFQGEQGDFNGNGIPDEYDPAHYY